MPERAAKALPPDERQGIYGEQNGLIYFYQASQHRRIRPAAGDFPAAFSPFFARQPFDLGRDGPRPGLCCCGTHRDRRARRKCSRKYAAAPMSEVSALACTAGGVLYVGTLHSGALPPRRTRCGGCIPADGFEDQQPVRGQPRRLWVCTRSEGLYRLDAGGGVRRFVHDPRHPEGLADNYVRCICEDDEGRLWIGMMVSGWTATTPRRTASTTSDVRTTRFTACATSRWSASCATAGVRSGSGRSIRESLFPSPRSALFRVVPIEGGDTTWTIVADVTARPPRRRLGRDLGQGLYFYDRTRRRGFFFNMATAASRATTSRASATTTPDATRGRSWGCSGRRLRPRHPFQGVSNG